MMRRLYDTQIDTAYQDEQKGLAAGLERARWLAERVEFIKSPRKFLWLLWVWKCPYDETKLLKSRFYNYDYYKCPACSYEWAEGFDASWTF